MITLTDETGRQFHFTGTEEQAMGTILLRNSEARAQLISAIIEFDTRRQKLMAEVLAGKKVGEYGSPWEPADAQYKKKAIGWIWDEYNKSMEYLLAVLGEGADEMISAYRSQTSPTAIASR